MTEEKKDPKVLTISEKAVNWAKALGIILPLIGTGVVSTWGLIKSDSAENGLDNLIQQLNERVAKHEKVINAQSDRLEKMAKRLIFFQAHQAGFNSGKLYSELEQTRKELADLRAKKITKSVGQKKLAKILRKKMVPSPTIPVKRADPPPPTPKPQPKSAPPEQKTDDIPRLKPKPFKKDEMPMQKKLSF